MDWEAQDDGFVAKILAQEGAKDIAVGSPVLVIVEEEVCPPPFLSTLVSTNLGTRIGVSSCPTLAF